MSATTTLEAPPTRVAAVDPDGFLKREWRNFLLTLQNTGQASPQILSPQTYVTGQTAAITTTVVTLPAIVQGFYRVSVFQQIQVAAATSSSMQVTLTWTNESATVTQTLAAFTKNVAGASDNISFPIHMDAVSPFTYAVAYASNLANTMAYALGIVVEEM